MSSALSFCGAQCTAGGAGGVGGPQRSPQRWGSAYTGATKAKATLSKEGGGGSQPQGSLGGAPRSPPTAGSQEGQPHPDNGPQFLGEGGQMSGYSHWEARRLGAPRRGSGLSWWGPRGPGGSPPPFREALEAGALGGAGQLPATHPHCHRPVPPPPRLTHRHLCLLPSSETGVRVRLGVHGSAGRVTLAPPSSLCGILWGRVPAKGRASP